MKTKITAKAKVQVTVEVEESLWGEDCTIGQLYKQAGASAVFKVSKLINESNQNTGVKLVGDPKVFGIITES